MKNLNPKFLEILEKIYSKEDQNIISEWFNVYKRNSVFRINTLKSDIKEIEQILKENKIEFEKVDFLENAYRIESWKVEWVLRELFENWKIYFQSVSSQIPVSFLDIKPWEKILDITASPWWKTSQIATKLQNIGEIVAVDNNAIRIEKLKFTLDKQWVKNAKVVKCDARNLDKIISVKEWYFDKIIADLPCSAEWKFNLNNEKSFAYWNEEIVKKNYKLQKEILKTIIPLLKEGWELIYSTCTINPFENEDIVHFVLCNFPEMKLEDISLNFEYVRPWILKFENKSFKKEVSKCIRILPSVISEGFFIWKFKKTSFWKFST